jgi:hypothetical protein
MIDWLANFALIEVFPVTQNAISLSGVLVVFAGLCALAIVFVWKFLPETKNLPVRRSSAFSSTNRPHCPRRPEGRWTRFDLVSLGVLSPSLRFDSVTARAK